MKGNFIAHLAKLLARLLHCIIKKAIALVVYLSYTSEKKIRRRSSDGVDPFQEPRYLRYLLYFLLSKSDREGMSGDLVHHYKRIFDDAGREEADRWLREEMVDSLQRLSFRRAVLTHVWAAARKKHILGAAFVILALPLLDPARRVIQEPLKDNVTQGIPPPHSLPEQRSSSRRPALKTSEPLPAAVSRAPRRPPPRKAERNIKPQESGFIASTEIDLNSYALVREIGPSGNGEFKAITVTNSRTNFVITLRDGSPDGLYSVRLLDARLKPLATTKSLSRNGRLSLTLDMRSVPPKNYLISVSREDESLNIYPITVTKTK